MKSNTKNKVEDKTVAMCIIKGLFVAILSSLVMTMAVVLLAMFTEIPDSLLTPIDIISKQVAVVLGVFTAVNSKMKGWLTGLCVGFLFSVLSFVIYSVMNGTIVFDQALGMSMLFSSIIGVISGIIGVNLKKY